MDLGLVILNDFCAPFLVPLAPIDPFCDSLECMTERSVSDVVQQRGQERNPARSWSNSVPSRSLMTSTSRRAM